MKPISNKPKTCRECKQKFVPKRVMQPVCERYECMAAFATKAATKARKARVAAEKKREKAQKAKDRAWIEANRSYGYLVKKAQEAVNEYVRWRDYGKPCISCPKDNIFIVFGGAMDAGHYRSVGSSPETRFVLLNIHGQCKHCNHKLSGNPVEYRKTLVLKYGEDRVLELEHDDKPRKYSKDDLRRIAVIFRKRARWYKRRRGL